LVPSALNVGSLQRQIEQAAGAGRRESRPAERETDREDADAKHRRRLLSCVWAAEAAEAG
jgi:hypothetical protein